LFVLWVATSTGCGMGGATESFTQNAPQTLSVAGDGGPAKIAGYVHTLEHSRFALGNVKMTTSIWGFDKVVGTEGVFATFAQTGWTLGAPNAAATALKSPIFSGSAADHNQAVLAYFTGAGLPADQVLRVDTGFKGHGSGLESSPETSSLVFDGYISALVRAVDLLPDAGPRVPS
jgi:hypothetical protein